MCFPVEVPKGQRQAATAAGDRYILITTEHFLDFIGGNPMFRDVLDVPVRVVPQVPDEAEVFHVRSPCGRVGPSPAAATASPPTSWRGPGRAGRHGRSCTKAPPPCR